jgi:hypothetical protein
VRWGDAKPQVAQDAAILAQEKGGHEEGEPRSREGPVQDNAGCAPGVGEGREDDIGVQDQP